jgi:hypothetical protein
LILVLYARRKKAKDEKQVSKSEKEPDTVTIQTFERAIFIPEKGIMRPFYWLEKRTSLRITDTDIQFLGRTIKLVDIESVCLKREPFLWGLVILGIVVFSAFTYLARYDIGFAGGATGIVFRGFCLGFSIYALIAPLKNKWVLVRHRGGNTYFKVRRGGTNRLYLELKKLIVK